MFTMDWRGLVLPIAYLFILGGALMSFSSIYRRRKADQGASLAPWFGPHLQRNIYLSLLHLIPDEEAEKEAKQVPDSVLRAALLRRAVEDMRRMMQLRMAKTALQPLLQRGSVGDDLWQRYERSEKALEAELRDVALEANALALNWGQTIFQSASEMAVNATLRQRINDCQSHLEAEQAWWETRRADIQAKFMQELDESGSKAIEDDTVIVESTGAPSGKKRKGKR